MREHRNPRYFVTREKQILYSIFVPNDRYEPVPWRGEGSRAIRSSSDSDPRQKFRGTHGTLRSYCTFREDNTVLGGSRVIVPWSARGNNGISPLSCVNVNSCTSFEGPHARLLKDSRENLRDILEKTLRNASIMCRSLKSMAGRYSVLYRFLRHFFLNNALHRGVYPVRI